MICVDTPTRARLEGIPESRLGELKHHLTYTDKKVEFELKKMKHASWFISKYGEEAYQEKMAELKAAKTKSLLFEDDQGLWTYSGLAWWLHTKFTGALQNKVSYPEPGSIPWATVPKKEPRPYQLAMEEALQAARHGAVEVGTGLGKSLVILRLARQLGLKTVIMTPSVSIAEQIHAEFEKHLGRARVGKFFGGKKDSKKLFVVGVDDSLTKIEPGSEHWINLSKAQVFMADESHLCPASTLAKVCFGLMAGAPYRFFFSGTQMRNDGLDLLLDAITGKIVYRMTVKDGVEQGYLAKPMFRMIKAKSRSSFNSQDANEMTREHLYYNPEVNRKAGEIANLMIEELDRPVVILVKEIEQFTHLLPYLRHPAVFAHGGVTKGNRDNLAQEYWDSDPNKLVEEFNAGKHPILVGTNCITTGTDIQAVKAIVYLQGGKSEIAVKQAVGRGTRRVEGKSDCYFIDVDVDNLDTTHRHSLERRAIYQDIYPDYEEMTL